MGEIKTLKKHLKVTTISLPTHHVDNDDIITSLYIKNTSKNECIFSYKSEYSHRYKIVVIKT